MVERLLVLVLVMMFVCVPYRLVLREAVRSRGALLLFP